jgi:hypothetical protein
MLITDHNYRYNSAKVFKRFCQYSLPEADEFIPYEETNSLTFSFQISLNESSFCQNI